MHRSRNLWIIVIGLLCLGGMFFKESPQAVLSALAHQGYADSPRAVILHFWNLLDARQIELAKGMIGDPSSPQTSIELMGLADILDKNPLFSLQKVDFLETDNPQAIVVSVSWVSPPQNVQTIKYTFDVKSMKQGWRIINLKRLP
ncbi:MAG: hypothetical protein ACYCVD_01765 [Desulfitobacteriaceae bacterium]